MIEFLEAHIPELIGTGLVVVLVLTIKLLGSRMVTRSTDVSADLRRRWLIQVRNAVALTLILGLIIVWGSEIRTLAISAVAVAAAIVIATKELIMCISGTILEGASSAFEIGDRIDVAGQRGDVFDQTLLTTTILEVGPTGLTHQYTGRTVVLPNSLFLSNPVINETSTNEFMLHVFTVPVKVEDDWARVERALLEAATEECAPFLAEAREVMEEVGRKKGLRALSVEPRVTVQLPEPGRINLVVRMPATAKRRGALEQAVLRRVLPELKAAAAPKPIE